MPRTIVLAYSGGLDTSIIVPWLREHYDARVICVAADIGQGADELRGVREKALASGAEECYIEDLREEFVRDFIFPTLRAGAIYNRKYLLGTAMARPLIAKRQVEVAHRVGADALAHGCTGKGNDQVRFEMTFATLAPDLPVIAPWREWDIRSREDAIDYAASRGIPIAATKEKIYSRDANLWHLSHEGGNLEDPNSAPKPDMFMLTAEPAQAPEVDRLLQVIARAELDGRDRRVDRRVAGQQDDVAVGVRLADRLQHVESAELRHLQVDDGHVGIELRKFRERRGRVRARLDLEPHLPSETLDDRQDCRLVVDRQQQRRYVGHLAACFN